MSGSRAFLCVVFSAAIACGSDRVRPIPPAPHAPPSVPLAPTASATAPAPSAPTTVKRVVISSKRPSGSSVVTTSSDGTIAIAFDVLENGRGPHADATVHLAPDGTIASFAATGHHEMGQAVEETFTLKDGHARWKSREESGDVAVNGPAFFVPITDCPDILGVLAQALLKAGGTLPVLPAGTARLTKLGDATVSAGGQSKHLTAYAIGGLDLVPTPEWLEDDGSWFGYTDPFFALVPEGWEGTIDVLIERLRRFERERDAALAQRLAHKPPSAGVAFTHARVLDVERGRWIVDQTVVVTGDTIASVAPSRIAKVPSGAETIDLAGRALLPGLWDMHAHLAPGYGVANLASGVTTVRDVGNSPAQLDDFKKRFDEGTAIGPRVYRAGFIEGRNEKAASSEITAENEAEAKVAVEFYANRGYEQIKIYNSIHPELVPFLAKEAHARGMTVTGHIPVHMLANEAVRAGYDGIEHVNMLFLNFFADHDTDTRTTLRFSLVGDKAAGFDFKSKAAQDFFALLRDHHTVVDPTLVTFEGVYVPQGVVPDDEKAMVARLPVQAQRAFLVGGLPSEGKEELYRRSWQKIVEMVRALHDAKVTVVAGTDLAPAGLTLHHELELFVSAGLTPADALKTATIEPARAMKAEKKSGSIAPGKLADVFVVDGDPLANVSDLRKVVSVMRGGVTYPSKELYESVGVAP